MQTQGIVPMILPVHVLAGVIGPRLRVFVALYAVKGVTLHRRSGMLFVYAMLVMSLSGAVMAVAEDLGDAINVPAGLVTVYLVTTALAHGPAAVLRSRSGWIAPPWWRRSTIGARFSLLVAIIEPAPAPVWRFRWSIFGVVGLLAACRRPSDDPSRRHQGRGAARRHLWRMCFAIWVAAASFFLGPVRRIPEPIRIPALYADPVLVPIDAWCIGCGASAANGSWRRLASRR